jgi:hypothetical protein
VSLSSSSGDEPEKPKQTLKDRTRDVDAFFTDRREGDKHRQCLRCQYVSYSLSHMYLTGSLLRKKKLTKLLVNEVTTLRRHIESAHEVSPALPLHDKFDINIGRVQ